MITAQHPQDEIIDPPLADGTLKFQLPRIFEIDFNKVTDLKDVIAVLKGLNVRVHWHQNTCPAQFVYLHEQGYLKEVEQS